MALNTSQNSPSFDWSLQGSASSPFAGWLNFSAPLALADTVVSSWKRRSTGSQMAVATNALMPVALSSIWNIPWLAAGAGPKWGSHSKTPS